MNAAMTAAAFDAAEIRSGSACRNAFPENTNFAFNQAADMLTSI